MCAWRFRRILFLAFLLNFFASTLAKDGFNSSPNGVNDSHEVVRVERGPPGVVWVVQVSDIHISKWIPERGRTLRRALGHALRFIKPAIVLVSGDLTDAKNKERTASRQDEEEWIEYRESFLKVVDDSGIPLNRFNDLRGNHDKYGVPPGMHDYYSKYSISAALNRSSLVQSVTVEGRDGQKHMFVGFDDSMTVGLRGPSNTFGHPTNEILEQLDHELRRWENTTAEGITKVVYGHYPMSFTTSTETGRRPEEVMAKNGVTAYLCGHLHTLFGRRLYKRHIIGNREFWEWEVGDWRSSRMLRVLAIDNGDTSFVDIELMPPEDKSEDAYKMPTFILQTYPLDSRFMLRTSGKDFSISKKPLNSIRALVFSETIPISVTARIYDFSLNPPKLVSEYSMKFFEGDLDDAQSGTFYYTGPWESERYYHNSGIKYAMQITVEDSTGSICHNDMRFFSVRGEIGEFHLTALAFLVLGFRWEHVFPVLLWGMILFLGAILLIPKYFLYHVQRRGRYEDWVISVFTPASSSRDALAKIFKMPFWAMVEGARNRPLWSGMLSYVVCLIVFPWFSGRILGDDYPLGHMWVHGWAIKPIKAIPGEPIFGLGIPDIMGIVLPYIYGVVLPLLLMLSALSAERGACEFHIANLEKWQKKTNCKSESRTDAPVDNNDSLSEGRVAGYFKEESEAHEESEALLSEKRESKQNHCRLCKRFVRKGIFVGCLGVAYIHWRLCSMMLRAYGPMALLAGPAYAWGVPLLLVLTLLQTSKIRSKPPRHEL